MAKNKVKKSKPSTKLSNIERRISFAWKNLALFLILFIISGIFYSVSTSELFINFFGLLSIIFGFLVLAFLISLILLLIIKSGKK
ncbi:MAG: hypothetical protein KatS3mg001_128 [Candidatus Pacearchaeota archaeon]|nr:MAG: hypothetical protein KatS3mg001_128 [Candidatus Pacearchaeota archaeon]